MVEAERWNGRNEEEEWREWALHIALDFWEQEHLGAQWR